MQPFPQVDVQVDAQLFADDDAFFAQDLALALGAVLAIDNADPALAVDDSLPGDIGIGGIVIFIFQGVEGIADGAGRTGSSEHLSDTAVAGHLAARNTTDHGVYLLVEIGGLIAHDADYIPKAEAMIGEEDNLI